MTVARNPALLPVGTRVKLSAKGLEVSGPRHHGYDASTRGVVEAGKWQNHGTHLAVKIDGEDSASHWPVFVWEPE